MNCPASSRTVFGPTPHGGSGRIVGFGPTSLVPSISEPSHPQWDSAGKGGKLGRYEWDAKAEGAITPFSRHREWGDVETPGAKALRHRHQTECHGLRLLGLLRPSAHHDAR